MKKYMHILSANTSARKHILFRTSLEIVLVLLDICCFCSPEPKIQLNISDRSYFVIGLSLIFHIFDFFHLVNIKHTCPKVLLRKMSFKFGQLARYWRDNLYRPGGLENLLRNHWTVIVNKKNDAMTPRDQGGATVGV